MWLQAEEIQVLQLGVRPFRTDLTCLVTQVFAQLGAVDRPLSFLMPDDEFDHALPNCPGDCFPESMHSIMIYI